MYDGSLPAALYDREKLCEICVATSAFIASYSSSFVGWPFAILHHFHLIAHSIAHRFRFRICLFSSSSFSILSIFHFSYILIYIELLKEKVAAHPLIKFLEKAYAHLFNVIMNILTLYIYISILEEILISYLHAKNQRLECLCLSKERKWHEMSHTVLRTHKFFFSASFFEHAFLLL